MSDEDGIKRCQFVVPRKQRRCRMMVKAGNQYCGEHAFVVTGENKRIVCPLDSHHTVSVNELRKHLSKCPSRLLLTDYVCENVNLVAPCLSVMRTDFNRLSSELFHKVRDCFERLHKDTVCHTLTHSFLEKRLAQDGIGRKNRKHLLQQSSLLGHLEAIGAFALPNCGKVCFVEIGAGKAQLSSWIMELFPHEKASYVLIDRSGTRNKFENKVKQQNPQIDVQRLRCSVEHLKLAEIQSVSDATKKVVLFKHLCGVASDVTLRCLANAANDGVHIDCLAMAPCCHHKIDCVQYSGMEFLNEQGFTVHDLPHFRTMASWAVCGLKLIDRDTDTDEFGLSAEEKESLGQKAKFIVETGRLKYLEKLGFDVRLIYFIDSDVTPENLLIVATKK